MLRLLLLALLWSSLVSSSRAGIGSAITGDVTVNTPFDAVSTLSTLTLSSGTLSPGFASSTTSYTASVANSTSLITVRPTVSTTTAAVRVNGALVTSGSNSQGIPLTVGSNTITILGTAEDGVTLTSYTVTVTRMSNDSTLSALTMSSGTLSPSFASSTTSYTASVADTTSSFTVRPTLSTTTATVRVNGTLVNSGSDSQNIPLSVGNNTITVVGTAQDGTTTYTITVTRRLSLAADFTSPSSIPVTAASYTATGNDVQLSLGFAPPVGTNLTVVKNTGLPFINGHFSNLTHGQAVNLSYDGITYKFVANYYGGSGNDLVLHWAQQDLVAWGLNSYGAFGNGGTANSSVPTLVNQIVGKTIVQVSAGGSRSLALCSDGTVLQWGSVSHNEEYNLSPVVLPLTGVLAGKSVISVSAGTDHSLVLCSDGTMAAWGYNSSGRLGNGSTLSSIVPVLVTQSAALTDKNVVAISAGKYCSLALCSDGSIVTWGWINTSWNGSIGYHLYATVPVAVNGTGVLSGKEVVTISAGGDRCLALCSDGTVVQWGGLYSSSGLSNELVTVTNSGVLSGKTVVDISAGNDHCVALCSDGTIAAWGWNYAGQLGDGSTTYSSVPVLVSQSGVLSGKTVVAVSAASGHSLALCSDGTIAAWGYNVYGQLGNNSTTSSSVPVQANQTGVLSNKTVVSLAAGESHSLAMSCIQGSAYLANLTLSSGDLKPAFNSSTTNYSVSVTTSVITIRPTVADTAATITVNGITMTSAANGAVVPLDNGLNFITVLVTARDGITTSTHTIIVTRLPFVADFTSPISIPITAASYTATGNDVQLSLGFAPPVGTNLTIVKNTGLPFISGEFSNLAHGEVVNLSYSGRSYRFVANYYGGSGNDLVLEWAFRDLAAWGVNSDGRLGNNSTTNSSFPVLVTQGGVLSGKTVVAVSAGTTHSLALCSDGTIAAWGSSLYGQLGDGSINGSSSDPVLVNQGYGLSGKTVVAVSAGENHNLALCSDGTIAAWGSSLYGQLGNGITTGSYSVPVLVNQSYEISGKTVVAVSAGEYHSLALWSDGTIAAWGRNQEGQLGNNSTTNSSVPVLVTQNGVLAGKTVVAVSAGSIHSLALCSDGTVAAWGLNQEGQLGNNSTTNSRVPVLVSRAGALSGKTVVAVSAGDIHSLALCSDGTIAAWGNNGSGRLGNNSTTNSSIPVLVNQSGVLSGKTVVAVSAGGVFNLALCSDGTIAAWGYNLSGALGNGSTTNSSIPVLVHQSGVLSGKNVVTVSAGDNKSLAMTSYDESSAGLSNLSLSSGNLNPNFDPTTIVYSVNVLNDVSSLTVLPTALVEGLSVLKVNGSVVAYGSTSQSIPLAVGANNITVDVTAPDGITTKTYTVTVTRAPSAVSTLSALTLSSGTLSPGFGSSTTSYTASVANASTSITVRPTLTTTLAMVRVNGVLVTSGSDSQSIPLTVGNNTITVEGTAQDGTTTSTYTVTVTRISNVSTLSSVTLSSGTLSPEFISTTTSYTAIVADTTSITVKPTVSNSFASVRVNGTLVTSGSASQSIPLALGSNTITVVGTAQDGTSTSTYTLSVTRLPFTDSTLSALTLSSGTLSPGFGSSTTSYTASVANATTSITVRPTLSTTTATVRVNGALVTTGSNSQSIPLTVGDNTITILGTAEDGVTTTSYTVTVTRAPSAVSTISALTLSSGTLSPVFAAGTRNYTASVTNATTSITVRPTVTDATATIKVNGTTVASGSNSSALPLEVGPNTITVVGTAQDGISTSTYTVVVTRAPSAVSTLAGLTLSSGTLSPSFFTGTMSYTASVPSSVKSLQVTPTVTDSTASVKVNGLAVASGASSSPISLSVGNNPIQVVVTAQDGSTTSNYTVTVFVPSADATLSGLTCNSGSLSPSFTSGTTAYAVNVANDCTGVTLTPTVTEPNATVQVNGNVVSTGTSSVKIPVLASGNNVINVVITAQDGTTTQTYAVTVNRPPLTANFASATTVPLSVSSYDATGNFANLSLGYAPAPGTTLTLVKLTGLGFIQGRFTNLEQGQYVSLVYQGVVYRFVVNYYGGTGNDLVLQWANGQTYAWGANGYGQLGNNGTSNSSLPTSVLGSGALSSKTVVALSAGSFHSLALCADGTLVAWGRNDLGQLGDNSTTSSSVPVGITNSGALSGKTVVAISAGYYHNLALCSDGTVAAWGQNTYGQLGDGTKTNSSLPVAVSSAGGLSGKTVSGIAAGYYHNLAQCTDGSLVAWGRNTYGQLGNNSTTDSSMPVDITRSGVLSGLAVAQFVVGSDHSLVLCTDGSLAAWGRNNHGQLGEGTGANSSLPVEVDSTDVLAGKIVTSISAGGWHNFALCSDGTLAAFGRNTSGQLGDGGTTNSGLPLVANLSGLSGKAIAAVQATNGHSLALCADGSIYAWGSSSNGQLGNGGTTSSSLPVAVTTSPLGSGERFMTLATGTSASHSLALVASPPTNTGFSVWAAGHAGLSDSTAMGDPDGDGVPNVLEYVLNGNPAVASAGVLPVVSQNASSFLFSYSRAVASVADTTQVFQYSTDLSHWTELSLTPPTDARVTLGAEDGAGMQLVTVTISKAANSAMFGRLQVVKP